MLILASDINFNNTGHGFGWDYRTFYGYIGALGIDLWANLRDLLMRKARSYNTSHSPLHVCSCQHSIGSKLPLVPACMQFDCSSVIDMNTVIADCPYLQPQWMTSKLCFRPSALCFCHNNFPGGELLICSYTSQMWSFGGFWWSRVEQGGAHFCNNFSTRCRTGTFDPPLLLIP